MTKTVFISGGSRGIGAAIVRAAAGSGWSVAFSYMSQADKANELAAELGKVYSEQQFKAYELDVRDSKAVDAVADKVLVDFENVSAIIPNAGIAVNGLAYSLQDEDWNQVIDTNLTGAFYVCRAFLPEFIAAKHGRILLISSVSAGGATGQVAYAASKAGLIGLMQSLAKEYGVKGITTNALIPGYFDTDMTRDSMSSDLSKFAIDYCPLKRLGSLEELAQTALFMIGDNSGFINGETIRVTGGLDWAP